MAELLTYHEVVLEDHPWVFWKLDEPPQPPGTLWYPQDSSGNGIHGTANYEFLPGKPGVVDDGGFAAQGQDILRSYVLSPNSFGDQPINTSYTAEAWVRTTGAGTGGRIVCGDYGSINVNSNGTLGTFDGRPDFTVYTPAGTTPVVVRTAQAGFTINDGKDHYLVGVYDAPASQIRLYVDGVMVKATGVTGNVGGWGDFRLDSSASGSYHFVGFIDCAAFYKYALSDARIDVHWQVGRRKGLQNVGRTAYIQQLLPGGGWRRMDLVANK